MSVASVDSPLRRWSLRLGLFGGLYLLMGGILHILIDERGPTPDQYPAVGDVLVNQVAGETVVFRAVPSPGRDGLSILDVVLSPAGAVPVAHLHPDTVETFVVTQGNVLATVDGVAHELGPGDALTVPAGKPHTLRNAGQAPAQVQVRLDPTGQMHLALVQVHGYLDAAGGEPGVGGFLQMLRFAERYGVYLAGPPVWFQQLGIFAIAPTARLLGYRSFESRYAEQARSPERAQIPR